MTSRRPLTIVGGAAAELPAGDTLPLDAVDWPQGYIDGLQMVWVSGTALTVKSGAAYIPGLSKVLRSTSDIAKTGLSLTASTWYHVYLYNNAGTPDVELVTTAPAAPYNGTARSKMGDTSRRYIGSALTDPSSNIYPVYFFESGVFYVNGFAGAAPYRVISSGTATTSTAVSLAGIIPVTADSALVRIALTNTNSGASAMLQQQVGSLYFNNANNASLLNGAVPIKNQSMAYIFPFEAPIGGGIYIDVWGYSYGR